jgi:rhamnopyranosyl-N-acetylglucosaminyl-diphospho-decaprenol beta-1,3/1,4-galactofuranosyltransferase
MKDKVFAILLCYNTPYERLQEIIESIINQTYEVYKILIWDNASSNKIDEFLSENNFLNNEKIIYIKSQENLGAGGGFSAAIEYIENKFKDFDWIWFIEDDVKPEINCLEIMLKFKNLSKFICPVLKLRDGTITDYQSFYDYRIQSWFSIKNKRNDYCYINIKTFEGILVHKELFKIIGLPPKENFIMTDDTIFILNASLYENILLAKNAHFTILKDKKSYYLRPKSVYYSLRNLFLIKKFLEKNDMFSVRVKIAFYLLFIYRAFSYLFKFTFIHPNPKGIYAVIIGAIHGLRGRFGKYL